MRQFTRHPDLLTGATIVSLALGVATCGDSVRLRERARVAGPDVSLADVALLEGGDGLAHGGLGDAEVPRRRGEAPQLGYPDEAAQAVESIHAKCE